MSTIDPKAVWPGWETVRLIGRGSFGAVYEIQRDVFGETEKAALKLITIPQSESDIGEMISDGYDEESITSTFQAHLKSIVAEYSLMRKLNGSANVVNCDDVRYVQHENGFGWDIYIKMELLTPLTSALPAEIPEEQAVKIGKDLARALVQCRQFDIVHRDIKPQNIFVSPLGDYKLGDFGIAKTVERTSGGTKIGTYKYMAPEVYNNQPYGAGADIYSLGLVLYWLLNERRMPFLPLPPAKLGAGMEEAARLRRFRGEAIPAPLHGSETLKQIVLKCCAFDPGDRFANAEELLQALENLEKNSESGIRNSEVEREELSTSAGTTIGRPSVAEAPDPTVGAGLAPACGREPEPETLGGASPSPTPEDGTVGVFGAATPVGAAISRPPVKEQAPDEDATVSAAIPVGAIHESPAAPNAEKAVNTVGADALGGPQFIPARGHETAPEETEVATVSVRHETSAPVAEPALEEDATVSVVQRPKPQTPKPAQESKNTPVAAKKPEPVQPKPAPQPASPVTGKKSGGKGKLIGILAAALVIIAAAVILILNPSGKSSAGSTTPAATATPKTTPTPAATPKPTYRSDSYEIGDIIVFGSYEQDNNKGDGSEAIEWIVIEKDRDAVLLLSRYCLDGKVFNQNKNSTWETSSLRTWLNGTFYSTAFTETERGHIISSYLADTGTYDFVFCLSLDQYLSLLDNSRRAGEASKYAKYGGIELYENTYCPWWLRSEYNNGYAEIAWLDRDHGAVPTTYTTNLDNDGIAVRPAIWLDLTP